MGSRATRLRGAHHRALRRALEEDVDSNLFALGMLQTWGLAEREGARWWGVGDARRLRAVAWAGRPVPDPGPAEAAGLVVPWGDPDGCTLLGRAIADGGQPAMVIGPRAASDALWHGLGAPPPRIWFDQRLYVCARPSEGPALAVRVARPDELAVISDMAGRMMAEDLGEDPRARDPAGHERLVQARLLAGRVLVSEDDGELVFKLDIGTRTDAGAQVGGTWVPPHRRGGGLATAGMRAATRLLLKQVPRVTLHVNEANVAAVRAYERAGYTAAAAFRLASR